MNETGQKILLIILLVENLQSQNLEITGFPQAAAAAFT